MNRNVESHFSMLPSANISRSRFDRSQDIKFTCNVGEVVPFFCDEVLPGDTFDITTSKVVRLQTLLTPIFDNIYLDTYFFFVPNRLVWQHWRELMGENTASAWYPEVSYSVPQIVMNGTSGDNSGKVEVGDILDYMGVPTGIYGKSGNTFSVNALPMRGYWKIIDEFFRDENIVDPVNYTIADANQNYTIIQTSGLDKPFVAAKYHDYFTSCLPSPQKGPAVTVPAGFAGDPWRVYPANVNTVPASGASFPPMQIRKLDGTKIDESQESHLFYGLYNSSGFVNTLQNIFGSTGTEATENRLPFYINNMVTKPAINTSTGMTVNVNDLRYAFQLQKLYERDARGGTRYAELIKSHFNVSNPDSRLQRPEYLGGNRIGISIHQIANQSQGENDFLGDLGAMSLTTDKHSDFVKSFTEHGFVIGLAVARYDHSYPQGLNKMWSRKTRFDYFWPVFSMLGEGPVYKKEICATGTSTDNQVFGYQERWAEYRYAPSRVAGEMRPGISNTLDSWHLSDYYTEVPTLSEGWIQENKSTVDRVLAVTSSVSNQLFMDIYVKNYTTRPMPMYSIPGLVDHF